MEKKKVFIKYLKNNNKPIFLFSDFKFRYRLYILLIRASLF